MALMDAHEMFAHFGGDGVELAVETHRALCGDTVHFAPFRCEIEDRLIGQTVGGVAVFGDVGFVKPAQ